MQPPFFGEAFGLRPSLRSNFDSQFLHQASRFFFSVSDPGGKIMGHNSNPGKP